MSYSADIEATDHLLHLPDGRKFGYAEYGVTNGQPVLFFHGAPGSRHSIFASMAEAAVQRGIRLIAPERPGYGLSDPMSERSVHDWITDVRVLVNALGISHFRMIGFSMGSLYALACTHAMATQVDRVAIVGGLAPLSIHGVTKGMAETSCLLFELASSNPQQLREIMAPLGSSAAALIALMAASMPAADQAFLAANSLEFAKDFNEALQNGTEVLAQDFESASSVWPFPLSEIKTTVDLWIGMEDRNTPPPMTNYLASVLLNSQLFELPGVGHLSLYSHWNEILERLVCDL